MPSAAQLSFRLAPDTGVALVDGQLIATASPLWLRIEPAAALPAGRWVRLRYSAGLFGDNVRPLLRITDSTGAERVQPMSGALFGLGEWIVYLPDDVAALAISPAASAGLIEFRLDALEPVSPLRLVLRGLSLNPGLVWRATDAWVRGARDEARRALRFAGTATDFAHYAAWSRRLSRPVELDGIDRARADWTVAPQVHLFLDAGRASLPAVQTTVQALRSQLYARWTLHVLGGDAAQLRAAMAADARIVAMEREAPIAPVAAADDLCATIAAGDMLPDYALAALVETAARHPEAMAFYGDEDRIASSGTLHAPRLKPDWSPHFNAATGYAGRPVFLRTSALANGGAPSASSFVAQAEPLIALHGPVRHIRRVLCHHAYGPDEFASPAPRPRTSAPTPAKYPDAVAIVPTRDNADCLAVCMRGLIDGTDYPNLRIVLVDNGSEKRDAVALLRDLERHPRVDILSRPGPFNYSALCNAAVAASVAPMLVLLNDDIAMRDPGWLKPMAAWAMLPEIGVVGAKLLFPSGRIQHAGVVLGLGGIAAHVYHDQHPAQAGYLDRLTVPHEVSAVTAACVAVERHKFDKIGGFDEINLPIDLNDIDLCLRLAERGHACLWTPESVLIHHESASRGRTPWSGELYRKERTYFLARWQDAIRDDRYFHPSLSLFSYSPALA